MMLTLLLALQDAWVRLHDGTLMKAEWTAEQLALDGKAIDAAKVERLVPGVWYDEAFHQAIETALRDLGADDYEARDAATEHLVKMGTMAQDRVKAAAASEDPEVAARARSVLDRIAKGEGGRLPAARKDAVDGALGRLSTTHATLKWRGTEFKVAWKDIAEISRKAPPARAAVEAPPSGYRRLTRDTFAASDRVVGFDTDAAGQAIAQGSDVEESYRGWGLIFDSEVETTVIYADSYTVEGDSRGNSGATQTPLWTGNVNLYFYLPGTIGEGRKGVAAGVHRIGAYVAAVSPGGTGLRAYDVNGKVLHEILTEGSGTDFLGLESPVPIHRVEIYDDPAIDPNFTTDDWVFGPIVTPFGEMDRFVIELRSGERLMAASIRGDGKEIKAGDFTIAVADLKEVYAPMRGLKPEAAERRVKAVAAWDEKGVTIGAESVAWDRILRITFD